MERLTKLFVLGWTCAALSAEVFFLGSGSPELPAFAAMAFVAALVGAAFDRRAIGAVLVFTYVFPVIIYAAIGRLFAPFAVVWMAGLLGAMIPHGVRTRWQLSARWRAPLVCWALTVAIGASIVVVREFDFNSPLVDFGYVSNSASGGWPSYVATWTLHVALVHVIGILWFDWLSDLSTDAFQSMVIAPLAVSGAAMIAVAIYQLLINVGFLNPTVYAALGRATGTVVDANVCGAVAALWIGGAFLFMVNSQGAKLVVAAAAAVAGWLAVWASGSRTGFAAAIIVTLFSGAAWSIRAAHRRSWMTSRRLALGFVVAMALLLLVAQAPLRVVGPLQRVRDTAPQLTTASMAAFASDMWHRSGYGTTANEMIAVHPWVGIGAGAFHVMLADFSQLGGRPLLPPDNAQNWFRHQLVEFGLLGSIGCVGWLIAFGSVVLRRESKEPVKAWILRGMLVAFATVSLVGVPAQDVIAAITFWTVAFWYASLSPDAPARPVLPRLMWIAVVLAVVLYTVPMIAAAMTTLRVPVRAQQAGWSYIYGFYPPERDEDGGERRWTARHAVAVVDAPTPRLALTVAIDPLAVNPTGRGPGPLPAVDVRVWVDRALVIDQRVNDTAPIEKIVTLPPGERRVFIETRVSRTFRPRELGRADDRELGLLARWRFLGPAITDTARP